MKYLLKKDLPKVKAGTEFEYKHNIFTGSYWVELVKWDTIGWILDFINGFGIDNDFFEPIKESKVWKPDNWDGYFYLESEWIIETFWWEDNSIDNNHYDFWNVYKTEAEAIKARDKQLAVVRCRNYLIDNDMLLSDEEVMNPNTYKYYIYNNIVNNTLEYTWYTYTLSYSPFWYINSEENAEKFIQDCEKDLLLIHLP